MTKEELVEAWERAADLFDKLEPRIAVKQAEEIVEANRLTGEPK